MGPGDRGQGHAGGHRERLPYNAPEVMQLLLHVIFHSPAHSGGRCISILQVGKLRYGTRPRSHRESMMELAFTACVHSSLSSRAGAGAAAEVRSSQPRGLWVNVWGLLTGRGSLAWEVCCLHGLMGLGGPGERGQLEGPRNLIPFSRTPSLTSHGCTEFQTTLAFCEEISRHCERWLPMEPSRSSDAGLSPV